MKLIATLLILMMACTPAFAGQFCMSYNDANQAKILEGLTKDGEACNDGETQVACAKRQIKNFIVWSIKDYEDQRDRDLVDNAPEPITPV